MTSPVETVGPSAGFRELAGRLRERGIGALPVTDERGRLLGIVSEADLLLKEDRMALEAPHGPLESRRARRERAKAAAGVASELMTSPVATIDPDAPIAEAARLMRRLGVRRLPVVDGSGSPVGIVSRGDLLAVFGRPDADIRREILDEVVVRTLLLDPAPFAVTVDEGVVTLRGEADRRTDATLVERLATRVDGVVNVRSELTYRQDDGEV